MTDVMIERPSEQPNLTRTQEKAAQSVLSSLKTPQGPRTLVILHGVSGIGKSTVLNQIQTSVALKGGRVVEQSDIVYDDIPKDYPGNLVTTTTVGDFSFLGNDLKPTIDIIKKMAEKSGINVVTVILPGMDEKEISSYIATLPTIREATLSEKQIADFSLGIPFLAHQLAFPGITEEAAIRITTRYLYNAFRKKNADFLQEKSQSFLQMPISSIVLETIRKEEKNPNASYIYDNLTSILQKQAELEKRGIQEESPLFISPTSVAIYNEMCNRDDRANIDIFVPNLTLEDLKHIQQSFGRTDPDGDRGYPSRIDMFGIPSFRKTSLWCRDVNGQEIKEEHEYGALDRIVKKYFKAYHEEKLGLEPIKNPSNSFFFHAHEHSGMTSEITSRGWMVESLLQQKGIPYFVNNQTYGTSYFYQPEQREVQILPALVEINIYE